MTMILLWLALQPLGVAFWKIARSLVVTLAMLSVAASAHAAPGPMQSASWAVLVGGNAADIRTTYVNLPAGGGRCIEGNSGFYGSPTPSLARLAVGKLIVVAPMGVLSVVLDKQGKHTAANVLRFIGGGVGAGAAAWNVTRACR